MYPLLVGGLFFAVASILALFKATGLLPTIDSGLDMDFPITALTWSNPFTKKSILHYADCFVALQADSIIPAILPSATSVGRPYVVEKATYLFNLTVADATKTTVRHVTTTPNLTYPTVLSNLHGESPMGNIIMPAAYNLTLTLVFILFLALVLAVTEYGSLRHTLAVRTKLLDEILTALTKLSKITRGNDPDMGKLLRSFLGELEQQGFILNGYDFDLSKSRPPFLSVVPLSSQPGTASSLPHTDPAYSVTCQSHHRAI